MKCPDCEKQPILDCETCHPCPKCGSEMIEGFVDDGEKTCYGEPIDTLKLLCTNEDCGHEEKVKG